MNHRILVFVTRRHHLSMVHFFIKTQLFFNDIWREDAILYK
jgi:hypothetical protein